MPDQNQWDEALGGPADVPYNFKSDSRGREDPGRTPEQIFRDTLRQAAHEITWEGSDQLEGAARYAAGKMHPYAAAGLDRAARDLIKTKRDEQAEAKAYEKRRGEGGLRHDLQRLANLKTGDESDDEIDEEMDRLMREHHDRLDGPESFEMTKYRIYQKQAAAKNKKANEQSGATAVRIAAAALGGSGMAKLLKYGPKLLRGASTIKGGKKVRGALKPGTHIGQGIAEGAGSQWLGSDERWDQTDAPVGGTVWGGTTAALTRQFPWLRVFEGGKGAVRGASRLLGNKAPRRASTWTDDEASRAMKDLARDIPIKPGKGGDIGDIPIDRYDALTDSARNVLEMSKTPAGAEAIRANPGGIHQLVSLLSTPSIGYLVAKELGFQNPQIAIAAFAGLVSRPILWGVEKAGVSRAGQAVGRAVQSIDEPFSRNLYRESGEQINEFPAASQFGGEVWEQILKLAP